MFFLEIKIKTKLMKKMIVFLSKSFASSLCYLVSNFVTVDSRYLEFSAISNFFPVPSAFTVYFPVNCLSISNSAISNYSLSRTNFLVPGKNYSRYLELFKKCSS